MSDQPLPDWFHPPADGWRADHLDHLPPEAPRRLELIDGALIVMPPQTRFHMEVIHRLTQSLRSTVPIHIAVVPQMMVTLGDRNRYEPDILVMREDVPTDLGRSTYHPQEVELAVEVVSPDTEERDRKSKPERYAEAGISHFWRVENEKDRPVVHVYELDRATDTYFPTAIARDRLTVPVPFPIDVDLTTLLD